MQDAFLPECVKVLAVTFRVFGMAPLVQLEHYRLTECEDNSDSDDEPFVDDKAAQVQRESEVQCHLMRMRRKGNELRSQSTVAEAVLNLLELRALVNGYRGVWEDTYRRRS